MKDTTESWENELLAACDYLLECVYAGTTQIIEQEPEHGQSPDTALDMIRAAVEKAKVEGQQEDEGKS